MMAYKGYLAYITFDAQAHLFHGEVINIRDVVTFQGQSVDELPQALADSVEDYLSFCAERGEAPDQPFPGRFTVRLSSE
jgi:predicted HicB family RNase H-like nuclease